MLPLRFLFLIIRLRISKVIKLRRRRRLLITLAILINSIQHRRSSGRTSTASRRSTTSSARSGIPRTASSSLPAFSSSSILLHTLAELQQLAEFPHTRPVEGAGSLELTEKGLGGPTRETGGSVAGTGSAGAGDGSTLRGYLVELFLKEDLGLRRLGIEEEKGTTGRLDKVSTQDTSVD